MNWSQIQDRWERLKGEARSRLSRWAGGKEGGERAGDLGGRAADATDGTERAADVPPVRALRSCGPTATSKLKGLALIGLGAGLMFYLDPDRGRRRRALVRDRLARALHDFDNAVGAVACELANRARGLRAEARSLPSWFAGGPVDDGLLEARVRSRMGRYVSHPRAIVVVACRGCVTLRGPILADEVGSLLSAVALVPDVTGVINGLDTHERPGDIPGLQGGGVWTGERPELSQGDWSPTARLAIGTAGGALLAAGLRRKGMGGLALAALGTALVVRGIAGGRSERGRDTVDGPAPRRSHRVATGAPIHDVAIPVRWPDTEVPDVGLLS
jgi:hypothetical protein